MRIACLLGDQFQPEEFKTPYDEFRAAGHEVIVIGLDTEKELHPTSGDATWKAEKSIDQVSPEDFDALLIPGGYSPEKLRGDDRVVEFTKRIVEAGKPTFSICHGPWLLITADVVKGRRMTAVKTVRSDLAMVGADAVDEEVVVDGNLVTSRVPGDIPAFVRESLKVMEAVPATR